MTNLFRKINLKFYFLIAFATGIVSFLWLLLLPSDPKNAWMFGFSKSRIVMLGGIAIAVIPIVLLWVKMVLDERWNQKIIQRVDNMLRRDLIWVIVLTLSSIGFVLGVGILSIAFGVTDIFVQGLFVRLAPWAFWFTVICVLNFIYFWYRDFDRENISMFKLDIRMWVTRYDTTPRFLLFIFFFPTIYIALYFALWKSQADHSLALLFMGENNLIELVTFLALFFGGIQGLKLSWLARERGEDIWVWSFFAIFSLGIIFVSMEEIAWGQQIFGYKTPLGLKDINLQHEITLHNIKGIQGYLGGFVRLFGWAGLIGILLSYNRKFQIIGTPPVLILWFLMIIILIYLASLIRFIVPMGNDYVLVDVISETVEMFIGMVSYLYIWFQTRTLSYGRLRKASAQKVIITQDMLTLGLLDGRSISVPLEWIPDLLHASKDERQKWKLIDAGLVIHWPELDIKLRVEQLLSGAPSIENRPLLRKWSNR